MLIVLDRDGVINHDSDHYIKSAQQWQPIAGSIEAIAQLKQAGHCVVVATNQSGIGRGLYDEATLAEIHDKMHTLLAEHAVELDGIYYCPHHPDVGCACRKPKPGLFWQIAKDFSPVWSACISVGDSLRDWQAANAVGCPGVLVRSGKDQRSAMVAQLPEDVLIFEDLAAFVQVFLNESLEV